MMKGIKQGIIKVILKPNSPKSRIVKLDSEREAYLIDIKAPAQDNKANIELVKFLSRELKKDVKIIKGFKNREKLLRISLKK
ncbi:YggU family protein [Candidatus Woesearchaeota archaeon CG1_02_33_12]|nr:MAG: YggU family protein [Candidatus Woesearchaeota archaeon CG1_02_33_12]